MKDTILTIALIAGIFIVLPIILVWLRDKFLRRKLSREELKAQSKRFLQRLKSPDLAAVQAHFGHALPRAMLDLYNDQKELLRSDVNVIPPDGSVPIYICFYNPADAENLHSVWPGCEGYFAIADDGAGNELLIDPRQDDPPVLWHDHEAGEIETIAPSLSAFMRWERRKVEE